MSLLFGLALAGTAAAQSAYPSRPVRLIAASAAGGSIDLLARTTAQWLQPRLKQPFLVENRPGAQGLVATDMVIKAPADGLTLLVYAHTIVTQQHLLKESTYDWRRDITPIAKIAGSGLVLIISSNIPPKTLGEFIAFAKANPGKLNIALAGGVNPDASEIEDKLGIELTPVMYKGGAPATAAIAAGESHFLLGGSYQAVALIQGGKARAIAYTGLKRHYSLPDVPTLSESGFPGYSAGFWVGLFGPAGLPPEITGVLNREIREMNKAPETLERYRSQGYEAYDLTPQELRQEMLDYDSRTSAIITKLGLKIN